MTHWIVAALIMLLPQAARDQRQSGATIRGVVLTGDATPAPIRHARVELIGGARQTVVTGDDGTFTFSGLTAGRYEIAAEKLGLGRRLFSANPTSDSPTTVVLAPQQQLSGLRMVLPRGAVISGTVTDGTGAPLDAVVSAVPRSPAVFQPASGESPAVSVDTDDEGRYRLYGLSPGSYVVRVTPASAPTGSDTADMSLETYYPGANGPRDAITIAVGAGDERAGIDIAARRGKRAPVSGTSQDASGNPVDADVRLVPAGFEDDDDGPRVSARGGAFNFRPVAPGTYTLTATFKGENDDRGRPVILSAVQTLEISDRPATGISLVLQPPVTLSGTATLAAGGDGASPRLALTRGDDLFVAAIQPGGAFAFSGLSPGKYTLRPLTVAESGAKPWLVESATIDGRAALGAPIEIGTSAKTGMAVVVTSNVGGLRGRISTAAGAGAPELAIVVISADREKWTALAGRPIVVWPDTNGDWSIEALPAGDYHVAALGEVAAADLASRDFLAAVAAGSVTVGVKAGEVAVQDLKIR